MTEPYRTSIEIAAEPEVVFEYLTRAEALVRWMGDYAVIDARAGGEFTVDINGVPVRGRFTLVDPPSRLELTWGHAGSDLLPPGSSTVQFLLSHVPAGTLVTMTHTGLPPVELVKHAVGWPHFLARLAVTAAGGEAGSDPFAKATRTPAPEQP